jgi:hypothetical protein
VNRYACSPDPPCDKGFGDRAGLAVGFEQQVVGLDDD